MPKGQKPYIPKERKMEANADLISRRRAVDAMPEGREKMKRQTEMNVLESRRERTFKADGGSISRGGNGVTLTPKGVGGMHRAMGLPKTPMPALPRMKPAAPAAPRSRMAMMSNGGKAKKGC